MAKVILYWKSGRHRGSFTISISGGLTDKELSRRIGKWGRQRKNRKKIILRREVKLGAS